MQRTHAILIMSYIDALVEESSQPIPKEFVDQFVNRVSIVELEIINLIIGQYPDLYLPFKETIEQVKVFAQRQVNDINARYLSCLPATNRS